MVKEYYTGEQWRKGQRQMRAPLKPIKTTYPFEIVSIDFLHLDTCKQGFEYILVVIDQFTLFAKGLSH